MNFGWNTVNPQRRRIIVNVVHEIKRDKPQLIFNTSTPFINLEIRDDATTLSHIQNRPGAVRGNKYTDPGSERKRWRRLVFKFSPETSSEPNLDRTSLIPIMHLGSFTTGRATLEISALVKGTKGGHLGKSRLSIVRRNFHFFIGRADYPCRPTRSTHARIRRARVPPQ